MRILGGLSIGVQDTSISTFAFYRQKPCVENTNEYELRTLTLNLVVEISAFRISGSYFVLDEEPENTSKITVIKKTIEKVFKYFLIINQSLP